MNMKNKIIGSVIAGISATAAVVAMSSPAAAATTYTPGGGADLNFVGDTVSFKAIEADQTLTCEQFDLKGSPEGQPPGGVLNPGVSRAYGEIAGTLPELASSGCTNPIAGATTVDPTGEWDFAITGDEQADGWPATLGNVTAFVSAAGCSFNVAGEVDGKFTTADQTFVPQDDPSELFIADDPVGFLCPILGVAQGQAIDVSGSWTNTATPPVTVANP